MRRLGVAAGIILFYLLALVSYGAYQIYWGVNTPQTLAGAMPCTVLPSIQNPPPTCPDSSKEVNNAILMAATLGIPLYIDQPYAASKPIILQSNLTISAAPGACIVQQFKPGNHTGVIGNGDYTEPINNVTAINLQICGDPSHSLGGSAYRLNVTNSRFYSPTVDHTGAGPPSTNIGGRAFTVIAVNSQFYNPTFYDPYPHSGNGAFRVEGCRDSQVIGGYGVSGDGTWQFSPSPTGTVPNQSVVRCRFEHVGGQSLDGGFFSAQLHVESSDQEIQYYMLGSAWPATGTTAIAHNVGDILTCTGGTYVAPCQIQITQVTPPVSGVPTQAIVFAPGYYSVLPSTTQPYTVTMSDTSTWNVTWPNAYQTSGCIIDSGISGAPGQAVSGRAITIGNESSNGGQCPGRAAIDGLTISDITLDDSQDQESAQVISVDGSDLSHSVGSVTFNNVSVPHPYAACVDLSGQVRHVVFNHLTCGRSHLGLVGYLAATAAAGSPSVRVGAAQCGIIGSNDVLGIALDDNPAANGSYAGKQQIVAQLTSPCSNGVISLPQALLGTASGGVAAVYDYTEQVYNITAPIVPTLDRCAVTLQSTSNIGANNAVWLVQDDNTVVQSQVYMVTSSTTLELSSPCPTGSTSAGNLFVDRSTPSNLSMFTTESVRGLVLNQPVLYGADNPVISLGAVNGSPVPTSDVSVNDARLLDVAPGEAGVRYQNCDFCVMRGGSVAATAGSTTSNLAAFSHCQPNPLPPPACGSPYTDNL
ncbi:MAG TPA: hypothetical protein VKR31_03150, partial [Rhizomicrobium sp.]|nr:hypothetical protein [Rhizomicrobium sp.]